MEKTYELLNAGAATEFISKKLRQLEDRQTAIETELGEKERELSLLGSAASQLYEDRDQIKALVARLQDHGRSDTYRLRAAILSKLRTLVSSIIVAPLGDAPSIEKAIARIRNEPGSEPVIEHFERRLGAEDAHRRHFIVAFADGSMRAVTPHPDDPLRFEEQIVGGRGRDLHHLAHTDLPDRLRHALALRDQNIDLAQLRDDLFGLVALPCHCSPP
jgi:hypothetical protein